MGESVHTKQNSYQAQNINYAENIHTNLYIKIIISYKFYNVCFLFLRSQSRTKILAYQKICTFTIRTKTFLTARVCKISRSYFDHTKHIWSLKLFLEQVLLHWFFLDKVTSRWKPQYNIFIFTFFCCSWFFFTKNIKKILNLGDWEILTLNKQV